MNPATLTGVGVAAFIWWRLSKLKVRAQPADLGRRTVQFYDPDDHPVSVGNKSSVSHAEVGMFGLPRQVIQTPAGKMHEYLPVGGTRSDIVSTRVF